MTGFLRIVGILNAAAWLGGALFFTFGVGPAPFSEAMEKLLGPANYPYYSGAIAQIFVARYFKLHLICGTIALLHLWAEWIYLGRMVKRFPLILLCSLFALGLLGNFWLNPKLSTLHTLKYSTTSDQLTRTKADRTFKIWHAISQTFNVFALGGLVIYVWRVNNPPDPTRFVSSMQFRG